MPPRLPTDRALALAASLITLRELWLHCRCGCGATTAIPLRLAVSSSLRGTLADLVLRLACKGCGGAPVEAVLLDRADTLALSYGPAGWRLVVVETS